MVANEFPPRDQAVEIWRAGVDAVRAERLVRDNVSLVDQHLQLADWAVDLNNVGNLCVVGAGKAAGYMAAELERILAPVLDHVSISGWVNVPADCVLDLRHIQLHAARPAGVNEPKPEGVAGAERILTMVDSLGGEDVCIVLLTGGGSALLPAPAGNVTLPDKLAVTRHLSANGANIHELNTVRMALSRIKGGGLARACRAGRMFTLMVSDVIGDPLEIISSGPTVDIAPSPQKAMEILTRYYGDSSQIPPTVYHHLSDVTEEPVANELCVVKNRILGNNQTAVDAAAALATRKGYSVRIIAPESPHSTAEEVGRELADQAIQLAGDQAHCIIWGGEPVVRLAPEGQRGLGGRNQQLVLAALQRLLERNPNDQSLGTLAIASGGTDGEDGPTDAAGAVVDDTTLSAMQQKQLSPRDYLDRNDAYRFFEAVGGLIKTGPTHTNVCDLRVVVQHG